MLLEYINYSPDFSDNEFNNFIMELSPSISTVVLPIYFAKNAKNKIKTDCRVSCLIDFPLGISDIGSRFEACKFAIKNKCDAIDIVMQPNLLANRKYDKIREEVKNLKTYCDDNNTEIRYILEYRAFDHHCLKKACEILLNTNITTISLSTGYGIDVLSDFIIASKFLSSTQTSDINIILTANFWSDKHIETILKNGFKTVRSGYIKNLKYLANFLKKYDNS